MVSSALSQGLVFFSGGGSASTRISTNTVVAGAATGLTAGTANLFYYALFASAANTQVGSTSSAINGINSNYVFNNSAGWTLVGMAGSLANAGRFGALTQGTTDGNQTALNGDGSLAVSGIAGGGNAHFVILGWSASIGSTLAAVTAWYNAGANNAFIGQSAVSTALTIGDGGLVSTPNVTGTGAGQLGGFTLGLTPPVPEPGTLALAALGGASLLLFRRKK